MKNILLTFFVIALMYSCSKQEKNGTQRGNSFSFEWTTLKKNGKEIKHAAMMVPVQFDTLDKMYRMQFDIGSNVNLMYGKTLDRVLKNHKFLKKSIVPDSERWFNGTIHMNKSNVVIDSAQILEGYGTDSVKSKESDIIGAIGYSQFENKILKIDFENQELKVQDSLSEIDERNYTFEPLHNSGNQYRENHVIIDVEIDGRKKEFIYDTGSSLTPIWTTNRELYDELTGKTKTNLDTLTLSSWDEPLKMYGAEIRKDVTINGVKVNKEGDQIYYINDKKRKEGLENKVKVKGLIGNTFFLDTKIVIDLKNNQFGVLKN